MRARSRWLLSRNQNRPAIATNALCPSQLLEELLRQQKLPVGSVEDIKEAVAVALHQQFTRLAFPIGVDHERRLAGVPVPKVVGGGLVIPFQLAGFGVKRQDAVTVEIVAQAVVAIVVLSGIAGFPEDRIGAWIVNSGKPR